MCSQLTADSVVETLCMQFKQSDFVPVLSSDYLQLFRFLGVATLFLSRDTNYKKIENISHLCFIFLSRGKKINDDAFYFHRKLNKKSFERKRYLIDDEYNGSVRWENEGTREIG